MCLYTYCIVRYICYYSDMEKQEMLKELLSTKRREIIWALHLQGYTHEDITEILRPVDRSNVTRLIGQMPENWQPKWIKVK